MAVQKYGGGAESSDSRKVRGPSIVSGDSCGCISLINQLDDPKLIGMKLLPSFLSIALLFTAAAHADSTIKLSGVHNCCKSCANGISAAVAKVAGAEAKIDKRNVEVTAKDEASAKQAVASLLSAGYFGEGATAPEVTDAKVKTADVSGLHLCCGKCVTAAEDAIMGVAGVTKHNATKGAKTFQVEGDFSTKQLAAALNKAGLHASVK
jgi:copper chaperone CopZ